MAHDDPYPEPLVVRPDAVLIVVDVQRGFADLDYWGRRDNPDAEKHIGELVAHWQATGRPIVLVRHDSATSRSPLHPANPGNALQDVVADVDPALLVSKQVNSAFYGSPDLHRWLQARGARQVVVAGIQTNMCAETTARMAGNLGYEVLFAIDAMHTFDVSGPDGAIVEAEELTRATAASLHAGQFARVVPTATITSAATP